MRHDDPDYGRRFPSAERAKAFGAVATEYDRGRPGYPPDAVRWAVGRDRGTVLDLGAGTGKLTAAVVAAGYEAVAVEPDAGMLELLRTRVPAARALAGPAEVLPLADASVDAVVVGQAWHWFDHARAAAEIRRVTRPGGRVALLYNVRDERVSWVARFAGVTGERFGTRLQQPRFEGVRDRAGFGPVEHRVFAHVTQLTPDDLGALANSFSFVALLPDDERAQVLRSVAAIADDAVGPNGMLALPYRVSVVRAVVGTG